MKRSLFFVAFFCFLLALAQSAFAAKDPEYLFLVFDKEGRLALSAQPDIYMALHQSLSKADLVKLISVEETKTVLAEANFSGAPPILLGSRIKDFAKKQEIKYLLAQTVLGRYDEGSTRLWLIEDGKVQVDGEKTEFSKNLKPPLGFVDTLLLTAMLVLEAEHGDASALVEVENYGSLGPITETYRRLGKRGVCFSRWHLVEAIHAGQAGKTEKALEHAGIAIALDPFWPDNYKIWGQFLKERGLTERYIRKLEEGLDRYPDNFGLMMLLILELDPKADGLKVGKYLARAKKLNPDNAALVELEITIARNQGKFDVIPDMVRRYYEAEGLTSKVRRTFALTIARDFMKKGKYPAAASVYSVILEEDPQASIFREKARCHDAMGDLSGKLAAQLSAFALIPDEELMWDIVDGARDLNQTEPALEAIHEAMRQMPGDPLPATTAGLLHVLEGNLAQSIKRFDEAMDLSDNPREIAFYRLTATAALAAPEQFETEKAQFASEFEAPDPGALATLLVRLKAFSRADAILSEIATSESSDFDSVFNLGMASLVVGDSKGFKKAFKAARKIEGKHLGKWGILLSVQYGARKKDKDLQELLAGAKKIESQRQNDAFKECYCFQLFRYQVIPALPPEQQPVSQVYLDFLDGSVGLGALAHQLTE